MKLNPGLKHSRIVFAKASRRKTIAENVADRVAANRNKLTICRTGNCSVTFHPAEAHPVKAQRPA